MQNGLGQLGNLQRASVESSIGGLSVAARKHTFDGVSAEVAEYCLRLGRPLTAKRGDILARQGDTADRCFYVRSGYGKVTSNSLDGHQILLCFVGPRDLAGQSAVTPDVETYLTTTVVVQPMELVFWTRDVALEISMQCPDIHARLDASLARNVQILLARLHTVGEGPVPRRLASALLELGDRHGEATESGVTIAPLVTREDLANLTGSSLYTASRVLSEWEAEGLIVSRRGRLRLLNVARLRSLAGGPVSPDAARLCATAKTAQNVSR
jgi:CRP/FNR family transcriptional regulator, nitrogen oxide reductase regulator